ARPLLAAGLTDGRIRLWDRETLAATSFVASVRGAVLGLAFDPTGRRLVAVGGDHILRVFDATTGAPGPAFAGHTRPVEEVVFTADGARVLSASRDGTVRVWDLSGDRPPLVVPQDEETFALVVADDGTWFAAAGAEGTIRQFDLADGRPRGVLRGHEDRVWDLDVGRDGALLASAGKDGTVRLWDLATRETVFVLRGTNLGALGGKGDQSPILEVAFAAEGRRLAVLPMGRRIRV